MTAKGVCRYCGCTDEKPCHYVPNPHSPPAGQPVLTAEWADKDKDVVYESRVLGEGGSRCSFRHLRTETYLNL
jgi:hypothetical protein